MNKFLLILLLTFFSIPFYGQSSIGVKGGYKFVKINDEEWDHPSYGNYPMYDNMKSYTIKVDYKYEKKRFLNWGGSLGYIYRSFDFKAGYGGLGSSTFIDSYFKFDILSLDIYSILTIKEWNRLKLYAQVGVFAGYVINSKQKGVRIKSAFGVSDTSRLSGTADYSFGGDLGLRYGLGVKYRIANKLGIYMEGTCENRLGNIKWWTNGYELTWGVFYRLD